MTKYRLSDVIDIISGGTPKTDKEEYWNGNIGWLSVVDFGQTNKYVETSEKTITEEGLNNSSTKLLNVGDIIISARGTVGAMAIVKKCMAFNQSCFGLRAKSEYLNQDYLFYYLKNYMKVLKIKSQGSVFETINLSTFDMINVNLPDVLTQKKIADVLSCIDDKIDLNNKTNAELEKMAKTVYDYWFTQFDFPDKNGHPYKTSGGQMVYNETLKREIPAGWEVEYLEDCVNTIIDHRGLTPKKLGGDWVENGIIALSAKIVKNNKLINLDEANQVSEEMYRKWMTEELAEGDILMTSEAPLGEFYFLVGKTKYCLSQRLFAIRANQEKILPSYLFNELSHGNGYSQIQGKQSGSTVFGIRQDELRKVLVLIPDMTIQQEYESLAMNLYSRIRKNDEENEALIKLRDYLLPLLMNGQIEVK